jgi:hypothetical protein
MGVASASFVKLTVIGITLRLAQSSVKTQASVLDLDLIGGMIQSSCPPNILERSGSQMDQQAQTLNLGRG